MKGTYDQYASISDWYSFVNIIDDLTQDSAVEDMFDGGSTLPVEVYDLQGRKIAASEDGLPSGLYIIRQSRDVRKVMK